MGKDYKIQIDEILSEITEELYEEHKHKMIESKEDLFLSTLFNLHIKGTFEIGETVSGKTYSIKEFIKIYLEGQKKSEFYDGYTGGRRRDSIPEEPFDSNLDYDTIHDQISSTWTTTSSAPYKSKEIPESAIPNILLMLRLYYHPVQKSIRTQEFKGIKSEDYDHFLNALKQQEVKKSSLDEYSLDFLLETTLHTELYKEIAKLKKELDEYLVSDLIQLRNMKDPVRRLLYVKRYGQFMKRSVEKWRSAVEETRHFQSKVVHSFVEDLSDKELEIMENENITQEQIDKKISSDIEKKLKEKFQSKNFHTGYKVKDEYLMEDYKAIMREITEESKRKKELMKNSDQFIDFILDEER